MYVLGDVHVILDRRKVNFETNKYERRDAWR